MQLPASQQERVKEVVKNRALTNRDRRMIFEQIGEDLDFTAGAIVAQAFLAIWAQAYPDDVTGVVEGFASLLAESDGADAESPGADGSGPAPVVVAESP